MATIKSVSMYKGGRARGSRNTVTSVEVAFALTAEEAALMPANRMLSRMFGHAYRYDSFVGQDGGELTIRYAMRDEPFGTTDPAEVAELSEAHVNRTLIRAARQAGAGSHGN